MHSFTVDFDTFTNEEKVAAVVLSAICFNVRFQCIKKDHKK